MESLIRSVSFSSKRLISLSLSSLSASALRFQGDSNCKLLRTSTALKCNEKGRNNSMEQDAYWEANRSSASQQILRIL
jgi:hypothetical protein